QTSVKYKAISYIEKDITRRNYLGLLGSLAASGATPSAEVMLQVKQTQELIQKVIDEMPAKMQRVFRLSRQEQLSHREIATLLDISEETVKKHIQHALQLIRSALGHTSLSLSIVLIEWLW
nr:sigma-70 family RNA polymerase sigma factor [Bacteroidota bacterium]